MNLVLLFVEEASQSSLVRKLGLYALIKGCQCRAIRGLAGVVLMSGSFELECMGRPGF